MEQTSSVIPQRSPGPELRLLDRRALVGFPALTVSPGLVISDFALQIPNVTFPFNVTGGALRYQRQRLDFGFLDLSVDSEWIARRFAPAVEKLTDLEAIQLSFRNGYLEGQGRIATGERIPFTFKVGFDADGHRLALILYEVRLYGFSPVPAPQIPVLLARFAEEIKILPSARRRGSTGLTADILPDLARLAAVSRGYRMPSLDHARLSSVEVNPQGVRIRFASGGLPPVPPADEDLMLTLEGARAFSEAEELIARGKFREARERYLRHGDAQEAHPFAAERLLGLLVADPRAHELVIDIAASLARRRERSAVALWAEAVVRECRSEKARAAERYLALSALARKAGEETSAFFAAESAARAAGDQVPQIAVRALHELLGVRPDHLPSLKALGKASDLAGDRGGAIRAYRRIAALARDPVDSADAHVQLARLSSQTEDDIARARLHCEAALRLAPDHPDALELLAELCFRSGEHLRAIKSADRLRDVALGRHELERVGRANLFAGKVWEVGLKQLDNALLRYREAASLLPTNPEAPYLLARVAERLGRLQEALAGYQQAVELAGPAPEQSTIREAAHQAHHALARMSVRLGNPAQARGHLEAALALDPKDREALDELVPYYRTSGRSAELAEACEKLAAIQEDPKRRAVLLAEAGELHRSRLGNPEKADVLLSNALELDSNNRTALEGMLALAESRRDGAQMGRCLKTLALLTPDSRERARHYRRLAVVARDLTFDGELAAFALGEILRLEPGDLPTLAELCALQRRRGDMEGLAVALEQRAGLAEEQGEARTAGLALRELAQVLEARLGRLGEAFFAIEKAARLCREPEVLLDYGDVSMRCEHPDHARRAYEAALTSLPRQTAPERLADIHAKLGQACDKLGDKEAARAAFAQALPFRLLDDPLATRLEELYLEAGQFEKLATLWFTRANALISADRPSEAALLFSKSADALLRAGDFRGALSRLQSALEAEPSSPWSGEILDKMSALHLERGEPMEAARLLARRAAAVGDARARATLLLQAARLIQGNAEEEPLLAQAIAQDGQFAPARIQRARLLAETDPHQAFSDLEAALHAPVSDPEAPVGEARMELTREAAFLALRAGLSEPANQYLEQCARRWPEDLEVQAQLGALYRGSGAKEQLFQLVKGLWPRLEGEERGKSCREAAELALELQRAEDAVEALRGLLQINPSDLWAAKELLDLLPEPSTPSGDERERQTLLSTLIDVTSGAESAGLLWRRAALHRRAGRLELAKEDLSEAITLGGQPESTFEELAEIARQMADEPAELDAWAQGIAEHPSLGGKASSRLIALGRSRLRQNDAERAQRAFSIASQLALPDLERSDVFLGLADAHLALADPAAAAAALAQAARGGPLDKRIEALLRRGVLLEERGELTGAGQSYEAVLALTSRHPVASSGLMRVFRALEDWSGLAEVLAAHAAQSPKDQSAPLYEELGTLYLERLGQRGPAEAALKRSVRLDPSNVAVRRLLLPLLIERGELAEAVELLEEGAQLAPPQEGATLLRDGVEAARRAGESQIALRLARKAHALKPAEGMLLKELSDLLYLQGALHEALPVQRQLAEEADFREFPEQAEETLLRLADLAEQLSDRPLAEQTLRRLLEERPLSSAAERLSHLLDTDRPREAIEVLSRHATQLGVSQRRADLLVSLARRAREELGDFELASRLLRDAAEKALDALPIQQELVDLYRGAGRHSELIEQLRTVAGLSQRAGDLEATLKALAEEAALCEQSGRVDDALVTLSRLRGLCEAAGRAQQAAFYERRRAELMRDFKLDLQAAEEAFENSFQLFQDLATADEGRALALRREDPGDEAKWLEKSLDLRSEADRGPALVRLGQLLAGPLDAPACAEQVLRAALEWDPQSPDAESLLERLWETSGRFEDLARYHQEVAQRSADPSRRVERLLLASRIYLERLKDLGNAATCLLAAHAEAPTNLEIAAEATELLHRLGRRADAAELDALLLQADPLNGAIFDRHVNFLEEQADHRTLAALRVRRAEELEPIAAAPEYLIAAAGYRAIGAEDRASWCEGKAFELAPSNDAAFALARSRAGLDLRRLGEVLARRAEAVPQEAPLLLRERAELLAACGEVLLAAEAYDDLLHMLPGDVPALAARADLAAQTGGPLAAQPFDRRLLAAADRTLPVDQRAKIHLRLGHAALSSGAGRDAAEALEAVLELDPQGARRQEALSLLADLYSQARNAEGLYRVTLQQAARARADESDALYRRAADLLTDPAEAIDALLPLATAHPTEVALVERTASGLAALGRHRELVDLYQKSAQLTGGAFAAELLEKAAAVAGGQLGELARASELREQAARTYTRLGQWSKAAPLLEEVAGSAPRELQGSLLAEAAEAWTAAGDLGRARALLERVAEEHPQHLPALELTDRLERVGAIGLALKHGFGPLIAAQQFEKALSLADRAGDPQLSKQALFKLVERGTDPAATLRLAQVLEAEGAQPELVRLSQECERRGQQAPAIEIYNRIFRSECPPEMRAAVLERLFALGAGEATVMDAISALSENTPKELALLLLDKARDLGGTWYARALEHAAPMGLVRKVELLRDLLQLELKAERYEKAVSTLQKLVEFEHTADAKVARLVELGELYLKLLQPLQARETFERALAVDSNCLVAAKRLFEIEPNAEHAGRFISAAEGVSERVGPSAIEAEREALAGAHEAVGQKARAYSILSQLEETPARLKRRVVLAHDLGLFGESLQVQERLTDEPAELEKILRGYLQANLLPFAVRLGQRLLDRGTVSLQARRWMAERLAPSAEGAMLAEKLWPALLRQEVLDPDGWTLFAEALRKAGRWTPAEMADGFGAALSSSTSSAPMVPGRRLAGPSPEGSWPERPEGLVVISPQSMPRLYGAMSQTLKVLAGRELKMFLHPSGGVEAYLITSEELVLGAGTLSCFGVAELSFLCALALALGPNGWLLSRPGPIDGWEAAVCAAFDAVPASLAASRVIAQLDDAVRGSNPTQVNVGQVLRTNKSFRAIASRALDLM